MFVHDYPEHAILHGLVGRFAFRLPKATNNSIYVVYPSLPQKERPEK